MTTSTLTFQPATITWSVVFRNKTAALNAKVEALALSTVKTARIERRADGWHLIITEETF